MLPMADDQASPIDIAPSCKGDTRMPAVDERIRYRPRAVLGSGAGEKKSVIVEDWMIYVRNFRRTAWVF